MISRLLWWIIGLAGSFVSSPLSSILPLLCPSAPSHFACINTDIRLQTTCPRACTATSYSYNWRRINLFWSWVQLMQLALNILDSTYILRLRAANFKAVALTAGWDWGCAAPLNCLRTIDFVFGEKNNNNLLFYKKLCQPLLFYYIYQIIVVVTATLCCRI